MKKKVTRPIEIRKAASKDLPVLGELWQEFADEHRAMVISKTKEFRDLYARKENAVEVAEQYHRKAIRSRNFIVYIAEADGEAAGYLIATIRPNPPLFVIDKVGHIGSIFVRKTFRGCGISTRFRDIAVEWFRSKGLTYMALNVASDNTRAHAIYRRWGFLDYQNEMRAKL